MKTFVSLAAAATLSALAIAAPAQAGSWTNVASAIQSVDNGSYTLLRIDTIDGDESIGVNDQAAVQAEEVQNAIRSNPALVSALTERHVQIGNVVAASVAANGGVTFYLR